MILPIILSNLQHNAGPVKQKCGLKLVVLNHKKDGSDQKKCCTWAIWPCTRGTTQYHSPVWFFREERKKDFGLICLHPTYFEAAAAAPPDPSGDDRNLLEVLRGRPHPGRTGDSRKILDARLFPIWRYWKN